MSIVFAINISLLPTNRTPYRLKYVIDIASINFIVANLESYHTTQQ